MATPVEVASANGAMPIVPGDERVLVGLMP